MARRIIADNLIVEAATMELTGDATFDGDFTVIGTFTTTGTSVTTDNIIEINDGEAGAGVSANVAGIAIDRGSLSEVFLRWNESNGYWELTKDGSTYNEILVEGQALVDLTDDASPQLGADLDVNGNSIVSASNGDITITPDGTGKIVMTKVDINSGNIDNTVIGNATPAAATFTSLNVATGGNVEFNNADLSTTGSLDVGFTKITVSGVDDALIIQADDDGAAQAPDILFYRNSVSPAAEDNIGVLIFQGNDSAAGTHEYAKIASTIVDPTNGGEEGRLEFYTSTGGTDTLALTLDESQNAMFEGQIISGTTTISNGSITDSGGTISFGDDEISTTGTLTVSGTVNFTGATVSNLGTVTTADINGGSIDGVTIGSASAGAGTFTNLTVTSSVNFVGATISNLGTVTTADINGGTIDGTTIGGSTPAAGTFTTLTANTSATLASGSTVGNLTLANGSITSSSGAISFGNENLSTTGTLSAATGSTIGNLTLANGSITDSSGAISFGNENLSTTGTLGAGATTLSGNLTFSTANPDIIGNDTDGRLVITSGTVTNLGANILLYGDTEATSANDLVFRASSTEVLRYDHSSTTWNFQDRTITTTDNVNAAAVVITDFDGTNIPPKYTVEAESTTFTVLATEQGKLFNCTTTFTATLPDEGDADLYNGWLVVFKNSGTGTITINTAGSATIDGETSATLNPGEANQVIFDGTNYLII